MKLKSFKYFYCLLTIFLYFSPLLSEEKIDIWKNDKKNKNPSIETNKKVDLKKKQKLNFESIKTIELNQKVEIEESFLKKNKKEVKIYGVYDPADNDFDLNMWSSTKAEDVKASLKRLEKVKLSKTAHEIFERIILSFAYAPGGMKEEEFADLKIDWLIKNQRSNLIETFLLCTTSLQLALFHN